MASDGSTSDNHHRAVKLSVGITVMSDVVVLIGFALLSVRIFFPKIHLCAVGCAADFFFCCCCVAYLF